MGLWDRLRRFWLGSAPQMPAASPMLRYEFHVEALGDDDPYLASAARRVALPEDAVGANLYSGSGRFLGSVSTKRGGASRETT